MKSVFAVIAVLLLPQVLLAAPPDLAPINRAAAVMGECAGIMNETAAIKAPEGLDAAKAAAFTNAQVGAKLVEIPAADQAFLDRMDAQAGKIEACGKSYAAAFKDSEALLAKLADTELSEKDAAPAGDAAAKYHDAAVKLQQAVSALTANEEIQPFAEKALRDHFTGEAGVTSEGAPEFDSPFLTELRAVEAQQDKEQAEQAALVKAAELKSAQEIKDQQAREGAVMAARTAMRSGPQLAAARNKQLSAALSNQDTLEVLSWIAGRVASSRQPYCYLDSYTRGVGKPVSDCSSGDEKNGWLCYPKCKKPNYYGVGPVCWQHCPAGYRDMGAICHIKKALLVEPKWECKHSKWGVCYMWGPDCPKGYVNVAVGCALKTPSTPKGYHGTGLDPMKGSYGRGAGSPMGCKSNEQYDAGLCYTPCRSGYTGVGPVCWLGCPSGKTSCGAGCANSKSSCASSIADMVVSPTMLAINIATAGSGSAATASTNKVVMAAKKAAATYKTEIEMAKEAKAIGTVAYQYGKTVDLWVEDYLAHFDRVTTKEVKDKLDERFARYPNAKAWVKRQYALSNLSLMTQSDLQQTEKNGLAMIAAVDPTGVAGVVNAFSHPICSASEAFPAVNPRN